MFRLAAKLYLPLLLLLPLLAWWRRFLSRRGQRHVWFPAQALLPAAEPSLKAALVRNLNRFKAAALLLFILALARPQLLNTYQVEEQKGLDILLTLDISGIDGRHRLQAQEPPGSGQGSHRLFHREAPQRPPGPGHLRRHLHHQVPADR